MNAPSSAADALARWGITVLERGWLSSNNVLLLGDRHHGAAVVDTGYCAHAEQTVALLRHALDGAPLARILNTHLHSDHCGGNAAVQATFGCGIDVPSGEAEGVAAWDEDALTYRDTGQKCPRFRHDGVLQAPGTVVAGRWRWRVIASPGHDPKSVVLYQPETKVLISADALWEDGFGVVFPELEGEAAFDDVGGTLDALSNLDVRHVIPGHGRPFTDMPAAIARARQRLERFVADPRKHAWHAAKVLVKFRLLETQAESRSDFMTWAEQTRYFELVRERYFAAQPMAAWMTALLIEMCERKAITVRDGVIRNLT